MNFLFISILSCLPLKSNGNHSAILTVASDFGNIYTDTKSGLEGSFYYYEFNLI